MPAIRDALRRKRSSPAMIAYASRTGTRRNLAALREAGFRIMVSARGPLRPEGFPYALDNGAWTAFREFSEGKRATPAPCLRRFVAAVDKLGAAADFIIVPDIVADGARSWAMSRAWLRRLRRRRDIRAAALLIAVQDGMTPDDVRRFIGGRIGIFVGGSTDWKLATMAQWGALAAEVGVICHVGRVNTINRVIRCDRSGATSFDGSFARYAEAIKPVVKGMRQPDLEGWLARNVAP